MVEEARKELLRQIGVVNDDPFENAYTDLRQQLYQDSGYRRPTLGSRHTIEVATVEDLQKFFSTYYIPNNMVITVVGDVTSKQVIDRVDMAFAGISAGHLPVDRGIADETLERNSFHASESDISTAYLLLGWLAPGVGARDYAALSVAANALGGGKASLMFRELRQKRGMGYDVGIMYPRYKYQSHVLAYVVTDPFKLSLKNLRPELVLDDVKSALLEQVDHLKTNPLSEKDLQRAKGYTIGTYSLSHQRLMDRAFQLSWLETVGIGYQMYNDFPNEIEKVTAADAQRAVQKYFTNYAAVLLLPQTQSPKSEQQPK